jgi:hypothetical protein
MSYKIKLKIGEFSRLMQVTVKTLRHYEQKELPEFDYYFTASARRI